MSSAANERCLVTLKDLCHQPSCFTREWGAAWDARLCTLKVVRSRTNWDELVTPLVRLLVVFSGAVVCREQTPNIQILGH